MSDRENSYHDRRAEEFARLARMRDHWWWRPGWRIGRSFYTWHITFESAPEVHELAAIYQRRITLATLDPVPPEGLHMTLQGVGFADEVPQADLDAIIAHARTRCAALRPFTLTLGPADADAEGVPLRVRPWEPVEQLRDAIREAIADVWGEDCIPEDRDGFHAHITVFYSNADTDASPLRAGLAEFLPPGPVVSDIRSVSLIRLNRDQKIYRWTTIASVSLSKDAT